MANTQRHVANVGARRTHRQAARKIVDRYPCTVAGLRRVPLMCESWYGECRGGGRLAHSREVIREETGPMLFFAHCVAEIKQLENRQTVFARAKQSLQIREPVIDCKVGCRSIAHNENCSLVVGPGRQLSGWEAAERNVLAFAVQAGAVHHFVSFIAYAFEARHEFIVTMLRFSRVRPRPKIDSHRSQHA